MRRLTPLLFTLVLTLAPARVSRGAEPGAPVSQGAYATDTGPLLEGTKTVAIGFGALALVLGVLLYVVPQRAVAITKQRTEKAMSERVLTLQEEDRRRIARELHDGAGQALTAARLQLITLRASGGELRPMVDQIIANVDDAMDEVRRSTSALAPPALAELGLLGALTRHCSNFASASGLGVRLDAPPALPALPAYVETAVYRIVQEALTNAARHGGARVAWVTLSVDESVLRLEVGDDGRGLEAARRGFGVDSIEGRARLAGGSLQVLGDPGPGPRMRVVVPVPSPVRST